MVSPEDNFLSSREWTRSSTTTTALWVCCVIECIATGALAVAVVQRTPSNHIGFDPRWLGIVVLPAIIVIGAGVWWRARAAPVLACTLATLLFVVALVLVDQLNLLVQYDEWLRLGMPPSPLQ